MAADGSVVFSISADDKEAQAKLNQLRRDIEKTAKSLNTNTDKRNALAEQLRQAREEAIKTQKEIETLMAERAETKNALLGMEENGEKGSEDYIAAQQVLKEQEYSIKQQVALRDKQQASVAKLEGQEKALSSTIASQTAQLREQQGNAGALERAFANSAHKLPTMSEAMSQVSNSIHKASRNILRWGLGIRSAFILMRKLRSAIKEGINAFAEYDEETKNNIDGLKSSLQTLKVAWGAAFAPILNAVAPMLQKLIDLLITAANYVQMFFAALNGAGSFKKIVKNNNKLADSYKGAGGAADSAKKSVMGFDELNKLDDQSSGGGGGGGDAGKAFDSIATDIDSTFSDIVTKIKENLALLELALGGFLLGLGAILVFTGANIPLGLGLMITGCLLLAQSAKEDWTLVNSQMAKTIAEIMITLGTALFVIGALLVFSAANIPLGIGMMLAGAAMVGAVMVNWNNLPQEVQKTIRTLLTILGSALIVLGAILVFTGVGIPLGLAMIVAGAAALKVNAATHVDWNEVANKVKRATEDIRNYMDKLIAKFNLLMDKASELKQKIVEKISGLADKFNEKMDGMREKINGLIDKINEMFHIDIPHIKLPHVTVQWEPINTESPIAKLFNIIAIPHFGLDWYAKGGIVDGATLIGAGEKGKEAIVPLERNMEWVNTVANAIVDGLTGNSRFADAITGAMIPAFASGQIVPPRSLNGGSMFSDGDIDRLVNGIVSAFSVNGGEDHVTKLYLDGREIAECVTKHQRRMERA